MIPVADGRSWIGRGWYYGTTFLAELRESKKHPGYYLYAVMCVEDDFQDESKRPILAERSVKAMSRMLADHNLSLDELRWEVTDCERSILFKERIAD